MSAVPTMTQGRSLTSKIHFHCEVQICHYHFKIVKHYKGNTLPRYCLPIPKELINLNECLTVKCPDEDQRLVRFADEKDGSEEAPFCVSFVGATTDAKLLLRFIFRKSGRGASNANAKS